MKLRLEQNRTIISAETLNEMYELGYRYYCDGDYRVLSSTDPWSGMPNVSSNTYFFDNKKEASNFAKRQIWVFNTSVHADVYKIPEHTETSEEYRARLARERDEKEAAKIAKEQKKASDLNMTVEEYHNYKTKKNDINRTKRHISEIELRLEELNKELAEMKEHLVSLEA